MLCLSTWEDKSAWQSEVMIGRSLQSFWRTDSSESCVRRCSEMNEVDIAEFIEELEPREEGSCIPDAAQGTGGRRIFIPGGR